MKKLISLLAITAVGASNTITTVNFNQHTNNDFESKQNKTNFVNNKKNIFSNKTNFIVNKISPKITGTITDIQVQNKTDIYVTTTTGLFVYYDYGKDYFPSVNIINSTSVKYVSFVKGINGNKNMWFVADNKLYVCYGHSLPTLIQGIDGNIHNITFDEDGDCWVSTDYNVFFVSSVTYYYNVKKFDFGLDDQHKYINDIETDNKGNCWATLNNWQIVSINSQNNEIKKIDTWNSDKGAGYKLALDKIGNCWALEGSAYKQYSGLWYISYNSTNQIQIINYNDFFPAPYPYDDHKVTIIYSSVNNSILARIDNNIYFVLTESKKYEKIKGIDGNIINSVADKNGNYFVSTNNGMYYVSLGSPNAKKIQGIDGNIHNITFDEDGDCWVSTDKGLYYITLGQDNASKIQNINNSINNVSFDEDGDCWVSSNIELYKLENYQSWLNNNVVLTTTDIKNLVWLKPDQIASNGIVIFKTTDQEINTIKVDGQIKRETNKEWNFNINDIKDKNHNYKIQINATISGQRYNINFSLSSLLAKPTLKAEVLASNSKTLKSTWFEKQPNSDFKKPTPIEEAFVATSAVQLSLPNPTSSTIETATIYGLNSDYTKTGQREEVTQNLQINGNELGAVNGLYEVDVTDSASNSFVYYLQVANKPTITNFFDTEQGKYFTHWASHNGFDEKYFENIQKIDDSISMNNLLAKSGDWMALATDQELADNIESQLNTLQIANTQNGLTQQDLQQLILNAVTDKVIIDNEDTIDYSKANVTVTVSPPKNQKTYQDNEQITYSVSYNKTVSTTTNNATVAPYVAPPAPTPIPTSNYNYTWVIILVCCLAGIGLIYLGGWKYGLRKLVLKKAALKQKLEEEEIIKMMEEEEQEKND